MMMKLINRKNVTIRTVLNATGKFTARVDLPFVPSEVVVKQAAYQASAFEQRVFTVNSDLVGGDMFAVTDLACLRLDHHFYLPSTPKSGLYNFQILDAAGAIDTTRLGDLFIFLEFNQYQEVKQ